MNRFVEIYRYGYEQTTTSAGKFPFANTSEEALGVRVFEGPALGVWEGEEYTPPKAAYFFPWTSVARLEYSGDVA